jgi:NAD+ kinase
MSYFKTSHPDMRFGIIANPKKYAVRDPLLQMQQWCESNGHEALVLQELIDSDGDFATSMYDTEQAIIADADVIIGIGGDGTMLHTARLVGSSGKPILGVNSGRLGFLATLQQNGIIEALDNIASGNYELEQRSLLTSVDSSGNSYHALNEFVFSKRENPAMIVVEAWYDGQYINRYWADGLIIATPTGSTAYNLSSNGPIVSPIADVMILTPICPHTLTIRPLVLPADRELKIRVVSQPHEVLFSYDGQVFEIAEYPFEVRIIRSGFSVKMIQLPGHSYFDTLRTKLMWGKDYREIT